MIRVTNPDGKEIFLAPGAIAQVHEAGASSQWHGIRAFLKTFEGKTLEVRETAAEVAAAVARASAPGMFDDDNAALMKERDVKAMGGGA